MARTYSWARGGGGIPLLASTRMRFSSPILPQPSVLERVIFGFQATSVLSPQTGAASWSDAGLTFGVVLGNSGGVAPDTDPRSFPTADWLWAGVIPQRAYVRNHTPTQDFVQIHYEAPAAQLETTTRRQIQGFSTPAVHVLSQPFNVLNAGAVPGSYGVSYYISVLYSQ